MVIRKFVHHGDRCQTGARKPVYLSSSCGGLEETQGGKWSLTSTALVRCSLASPMAVKLRLIESKQGGLIKIRIFYISVVLKRCNYLQRSRSKRQVTGLRETRQSLAPGRPKHSRRRPNKNKETRTGARMSNSIFQKMVQVQQSYFASTRITRENKKSIVEHIQRIESIK